MAISCPVAALSDHDLLEGLRTLVRRSNEVTADLIEHLAEVDRRKLHLVRASSLHDYCTRRLGLSDAAAYKRIAVARLAQRFAEVLERIRAGRLHLSGALERLLAVRFPKLDVAESVRKLPTKALPATSSGLESNVLTAPPVAGAGSASGSELTSRALEAPERPGFDAPSSLTEPTQGSSASGSTRRTAKSIEGGGFYTRPSGSSDAGRIEALSRVSYAVKFTASERLHEKIREAQALVSHKLPKGELALLFELAIDLLIAEQKKRRFGMRPPRSSHAQSSKSTPRSAHAENSKRPPRNSNAPTRGSNGPTPRSSNASPRGSNGQMPRSSNAPTRTSKATAQVQSKRSRYVPVAVRRVVAERDEMRCAYVDPDGERCSARHFLEFEHSVPHARGGPSDSQTLQLFCRGHNQLMARCEFGAEHIQRAIERQRARARRESLISPPHGNGS